MVPRDIIKLFENYFNDSYDIDQIKYAKNEESFRSGIFSINDRFKFEIEICPNGDSKDDIGQFALFLNLRSIPCKTSKIDIRYILTVSELHIINDHYLTYSRDVSSYRWAEILPLSSIKNLDSLTFNIDIKGLRIYCKLKDEEFVDEINRIYVQQNLYLPVGRYTWNISNIAMIKYIQNGLQIGESISSNIFEIGSFKWMIKLHKMSNFCIAVGIYLVASSPNIHTIFIKYNINFIEMNISQNGCFEFKDNVIQLLPEKLNNKNIINLETVTLKLELTIIDTFDDEGNQINNLKELHNISTSTKKCKFIWNTNNKITKNIHTASMGDRFISPCFDAFECKWCLIFYPNGYNQEYKHYIALFLNLISLHPNISCISVNYELIFHEINIRRNDNQTFYRQKFKGWKENGLYIKNLNNFTFEAIITVIDIYDIDGRPISHKYINNQQDMLWNDHILCESIQSQSIKYIWNIYDDDIIYKIKIAKKGQIFMSDLFKMYRLKWFLEFYPFIVSKDGISVSMLTVSLASMPPNIASVAIGFTLKLEETGIAYTDFVELYGDSRSVGWAEHILPKRSVIQKLNEFTFEVILNVIDIYDIDGNLITDEFIDDDYDEDREYSKSQSFHLDETAFDEEEIEMAKEISFPLDNYQWIIDQNMMKNIKNAENGMFFKSPVFKINGLKFLMQIAPNGANTDKLGIFGWFLCLASMPINVDKISVYYKVLLLETKTMDIYKTEFSLKSVCYQWNLEQLKFEHITDLKGMAFKVEIGIIDVFDNEGNIITDYKDKYGQNHYDDDQKINPHSIGMIPFDEYVWKLSDNEIVQNVKNAAFGEYFESEIFGNYKDIQWNIRLWPNGRDKTTKYESILGLRLLSMPIDIVAISVYFELYLMETNTMWTYCGHFRRDKLIKSWKENRIKTRDVQKLKTLTIKAVISMIDIYDEESNVVTDKLFV